MLSNVQVWVKELLTLFPAASLIPVLLVANHSFSRSTLLGTLIVIPGIMLALGVWKTDGVRLNPYLGKTAATLFLFTVLFSVGCNLPW